MLAFACAFTMFAGAAFTDAADINADNADAVELLTALNIIQGYEDGSFDPEGVVTRAEMAKMIYTIRNGGNDDASAYETVTTSFTDINGHWAEGYIKYLQNTGIVAGKSATKFDPNSQVTTGEAMKMALALAGYDEENAGLTGPAWLNNTVSYATTYGLTKDVHSAIAAGCTRQDAAQILSNTLIDVYAVRYSAIVENFVYDSEMGLSWGGNPITVGTKWMDLAVETGFITAAPSSKTNPRSITFIYDGSDNNDLPDDASKTFKNATQDVSDLFGYEVKVVWNSDAEDEADAIYGIYKTANNTEYTMTWDDVEQDGSAADKIKFDGSSYDLDLNDNVANTVEGKTSMGSKNDKIAAYADKAIVAVDASDFDKDELSDTVTFIDNDNDGKIEAVQINEVSVAKVSYVSNTSMTTSLIGHDRTYAPDYTNSPKLKDVNTYEGIAKDDYAKVTYDYYNDKLTYEKLDLQTGKIDATRTNANGMKEIRIDGEWYKASAEYTDMPTALYTNDSIEYVAIDNLLYHVKKTDGAYGSKSIAMLYDAAPITSGLNKGDVEVSILMRDGSTADVDIDMDNGWNGNAVPTGDLDSMLNKVVTYRIVSGEYRFEEISADNKAGFESYLGNATAGAYNDSAETFMGKDLSDDAVVFVYDTDGSEDPTVMSGRNLKNNTSANSAAAYAGYLYNTDNGFDEVMVCAVGYNTIPDVIGSDFGVLTADAYETELDDDGYRYFQMYVSGLGEVMAREKNGDRYTYDAGTIMTYDIVETDDEGIIIENVEAVSSNRLKTGYVTSDGVFDEDKIGLDNKKYNLTSDTIYLDIDTENNEGRAYGEEVKAMLTKADIVNNTINVRYIVDTDGNVELIIIDSEENAIYDAVLENTSAVALANTLKAAGDLAVETGDKQTVTVIGDIESATYTVPAAVKLVLNDVTLPAGTKFDTTAATEDIVMNGDVTMANTNAIKWANVDSDSKITSVTVTRATTVNALNRIFGLTDDVAVAALPATLAGLTYNADQTLTVTGNVDSEITMVAGMAGKTIFAGNVTRAVKMVSTSNVVFNNSIALATVLVGDTPESTVGAKITMKTEPTDTLLGGDVAGQGWYAFYVDGALETNKSAVVNKTFTFAAEAAIEGAAFTNISYAWYIAG